MPVVSITASVTVAKIKPTNFSPLRSAIVVPWSSLPLVDLEQLPVHNKLPGNSFRLLIAVIARSSATMQSSRAPWLPDCFVDGRALHLSRRERSDCEAIRVRGYGLSIDLNPSPVSDLTMRADLSLRE